MLSEQAHLAGIERLVYLAAPGTPAADLQPIEDLGFETLELPPLAENEAGVASHDELGLNRLIESIVLPVQDLDGTQVAVIPHNSNASFRILKRVIDLALAIGLVLAIWWAMIIIWAAVRLQSPGPGIYRQPRIGQNGRLFTCLKFRTMLLSTPDRGTHEISDTAVTGLGRFLRRTKLDELPQVFNVIRNEMTFVGPRPSLPSQSEVVIERERRGVLQAKPGITGLAQINGIDMSDPVRLAEYDQRYLELQSPRLDFQIMLATLVGRGGGDRTRK
ncbi:sugar transferase [Devosia ginsengisoli]|uniref:Sugar transferase n=2 Tax=Devosia ginsengisoli TaxID=400770 RepID=A0A5B8LYS6_9HYPH|nr:sugar transferase [Devosia ginsengisoli]